MLVGGVFSRVRPRKKQPLALDSFLFFVIMRQRGKTATERTGARFGAQTFFFLLSLRPKTSIKEGNRKRALRKFSTPSARIPFCCETTKHRGCAGNREQRAAKRAAKEMYSTFLLSPAPCPSMGSLPLLYYPFIRKKDSRTPPRVVWGRSAIRPATVASRSEPPPEARGALARAKV